MKYLILIVFNLTALFATAQRGYSTWTYLQDKESHLQADYSQKTVKESLTGKKKDAYLKQVTTYQDGKLQTDKVYDRATGKLQFHIQMTYLPERNAAISLNLLDSSKATYSLTEDQKIKYYVVDRNSTQHIVYTYDTEGRLIKCKDCLQPLGNHDWCVYYLYQYNTFGKLTSVQNYNLPANSPIAEKVLILTDTLIYNNEKIKLSRKESLNPAQNKTTETTYLYDKKGLLTEEKSSQTAIYNEPRSYIKSYKYRGDRTLKYQEEKYFQEDKSNGTIKNWYNKAGEKTKSKTYDATGKLVKWMCITYK